MVTLGIYTQTHCNSQLREAGRSRLGTRVVAVAVNTGDTRNSSVTLHAATRRGLITIPEQRFRTKADGLRVKRVCKGTVHARGMSAGDGTPRTALRKGNMGVLLCWRSVNH